MSEGAQAAKADLARLRKGEVQDVPQLDPAKKKAAVKVFQAGDALVNAIRTYSADHPTLGRTVEGVIEKLKGYWDAFGELVVRLEPRNLTIEADPVYTTDHAEDNVWFPLFSAGIRQLQFIPGATEQEIRTLFDILVKFRAGTDDAYDEDDPVTMLWVAELEHIRYVAVDSFNNMVENSESDRAKELQSMADVAMMANLTYATLAGESYVKGELAQRAHTITLTEHDAEFLREENLATLGEFLPDKARANSLTRIDQQQKATLARGCEQLLEIVARYVEALLFSVAGVTDDEMRRELQQMLCNRFAITIKEKEHLLALRIIRCLERTDGLAKAAMTRDATAEITENFIAETDPEKRKVVNALLPYCGFQVAAFLEATGTAKDEDTRAYLLKGATMWRQNTCQAAATLIAQAPQAYALELCDMIALIDDPSSIATLEKAFEHEFFRVRDKAARTIFARDPARSAALARRALSDVHSLVRACALDYLAQARPADSMVAIKARIEAEDFADLELVEKQRLYRALAAVGGADARQWLKGKLVQKNPLRRQSIDDERIAAASALAFVRDQSARDDIEKLVEGRFIRDEVRDAAKRALHALDTNRPEELKS